MAPGSSLPDDHDASVLALVTRLLALEYERGKLTAQLEFHLRVRTVAAEHTVEAQAAPAERPGPRPPRQRGELEQEIIADLAKCGALPARQIALHVEANKESVRQTMMRLVREAKVLKDGRLYRLPPPASE